MHKEHSSYGSKMWECLELEPSIAPCPSPCLLCSLGSCSVIEMIPWLIPALAGGGNMLDVLIHSAPVSVQKASLVVGFVLVFFCCNGILAKQYPGKILFTSSSNVWICLDNEESQSPSVPLKCRAVRAKEALPPNFGCLSRG